MVRRFANAARAKVVAYEKVYLRNVMLLVSGLVALCIGVGADGSEGSYPQLSLGIALLMLGSVSAYLHYRRHFGVKRDDEAESPR